MSSRNLISAGELGCMRMSRSRRVAFASSCALSIFAGAFGCQAILGIDDTSFDGADAASANDASDAANSDSANGDSSPGVSLSLAAANAHLVRGATLDLVVTLSGSSPADAVVTATGLPSGVTASPLTIAKGTATGTLHFAATTSATLGAANVVVASSITNSAPLDLLVADPSGTLDVTFDDDGIKLFGDVDGGYGNTALAVAVQSDGHIVVGGNPSDNLGWQVTRLSATGVTDTAFTVNSFPNLPTSGVLTDLAVGPDDKITVVGASSSSPVILRLNADGTADNSFNVTGTAIVNDNAYCQYACSLFGLALLSDGSAIVTGIANADVTASALVLHFLNNGSVDMAFAGGAGSHIGTTHTPLSHVTLDGAGRIVAGGDDGATTPSHMLVLRMSTTGIVDPSFGDGGVVDVPSTASNHSFGIAAQGDAGYVLAGENVVGAGNSAIGFIHVDGSDAGSSLVNNLPFGTSGAYYGVATQDDGKILVVGQGVAGFASESFVLRLLTISTSDPTFNDGGPITFYTGGMGTDPPGIYLQRVLATHDGRILAVGSKTGTGTVVMRFWQ